jgi:septum formation protein
VPELILASSSPYRRELLARFGIEFEAVAPEVCEAQSPQEFPADRALRLALEKARIVARRRPRAVVIGSDQVATAGEQLLGKPGDVAVARAQLASLSGRPARFYTACAVLAEEAGVHLAHVDTTTVVFRHLSTEEIDRYLMRERPYDCAGSFKAEALGISLTECIESQDPTALIGLPLIWLAGALREAGLRVP